MRRALCERDERLRLAAQGSEGRGRFGRQERGLPALQAGEATWASCLKERHTAAGSTFQSEHSRGGVGGRIRVGGSLKVCGGCSSCFLRKCLETTCAKGGKERPLCG
eukprot:352367-Chlamydomonas_euryale.AAC.4